MTDNYSYKDTQESKGAYSQKNIKDLIQSGRIKTLVNFKESHISVASLDITVEDEVYEIDRLFKPLSQNKEKIRDILTYMNPKPFDIGDVMYPGHTYLAKASIDLNFPAGIYMYANAKSSSGRNFLLVRILADESGIFDGVDKRENGYTGELWLTFEPLAYPIILSKDETYLQIRVLDQDTRMDNNKLKDFLQYNDILFKRETLLPYRQGDLSLFTRDGTVITTLYAPADTHIGYVVKDNVESILNLTDRDINSELFFDKVYAKPLFEGSKEGFVELKKDKRYLLSTNEVLKIPTNICSELKALDPRLGLFFSHFAGFFDPGFFGTGTLEIIPIHDMCMRHKDPVAKFEFEYLKEETVSYQINANYYGQLETKLPKQFNSF